MAASELLIMPSYLESLSMVALEAWAMGKPVLANAKCDVLQGQCLRSNAGLFYGNYAEFAETMRAIDTTASLQAALGRNGRVFFEKHYAWPVIETKYVDMLQRLSKESAPRPMEPAPGWFARRRRSLPPADDVVKKLPAGPYREEQAAPSPRSAVASQQSAAGSQRSALSSQQPAASSQQSARGRRDWRDARDARPQNPRAESREPKAESRPQKAGGQQRSQTSDPSTGSGSQAQRPDGNRSRPQGDRQRDPRRGRPQRRGRRPGGGNGGGAS